MTNVLLPDDATFETSIGLWSITFDPGVGPLARVTTPTPHAGSGDLKVPKDNTSNTTVQLDPAHSTYDTVAGQIVSASAWFRTKASSSGDVQMFFTWGGGVINPGGDGFVHAVDSQWTRADWPAFVAPGPLVFDILFALTSGGTPAGGGVFLTDDFMSDVYLSIEDQNPPTHLSAVVADPPTAAKYVVLGWTDPVDQGVAITTEVEISDDGGATWSFQGSWAPGVRPAPLNLDYDTDYYFRARAHNSAGYSLYTAPVHVRTGPPRPVTDPPDKGWCLTSIQDYMVEFDTAGPGGFGLAGRDLSNWGIGESPDGRFLYFSHPYRWGHQLIRRDGNDGSFSAFGGTLSSLNYGIAVDAAGNVYVPDGSGITKIEPDGTVHVGWVTTGAGSNNLVMGRDGFLYSTSSPFTWWRTALDGTVTQLFLNFVFADGASWSYWAVASDGTMWFSLQPPPVSSENYQVNTTLRRVRGTTVVDVPIQRLVDDGDGVTEADGGIFCDWQDQIIVPMETFQDGTHLLETIDPPPLTYLGTTTATAVAGVLTLDTPPGLVDRTALVVGIATHTLGIGTVPPGWIAGSHSGPARTTWLKEWRTGDPTSYHWLVDSPGVGALVAVAGADVAVRASAVYPLGGVDPTKIQVPGRPEPGPGGETSTHIGFGFAHDQVGLFSAEAPMALGNQINDVTVALVAGHQFVVGAMADQYFDGANATPDSRVGIGIRVASVQVADVYAPDLSWFLRVAPDGSVVRLASTWDYGGNPPPMVTETNIADGKLNTNLACEISSGGSGMSVDGKRLFFVDDTDENNEVYRGTGTLLRMLEHCCAPREATTLIEATSRVGPCGGGLRTVRVPAGEPQAASAPREKCEDSETTVLEGVLYRIKRRMR